MSSIPHTTTKYLEKLIKNNNREWFKENKSSFDIENEKFISFVDDLLVGLNKTDQIETSSAKKAVFRIYRDVRFSKDKTPYKTHFSGSFKRATDYLRGGYYFHIEPGNSFIAGGFWGPNSKDLLRIRKEIAVNSDELKDIITDKVFISYFGELKGSKLKTAPRGFDNNHLEIELLRFKQFLLIKKFDNDELISENFHLKIIEGFELMRPFFDYMSLILTTNENGESII